MSTKRFCDVCGKLLPEHEPRASIDIMARFAILVKVEPDKQIYDVCENCIGCCKTDATTISLLSLLELIVKAKQKGE